MLHTWNDIIDVYNSLSHTSKSNNNLPVWGEIFASAFVLNPQKADLLWQELIDKNVSVDEKYSKYFIAQIFNAIINHLSIEDAIALLVKNARRRALFLKYRCGYQDDVVNGILGFYVKYNEYKTAHSVFVDNIARINQGGMAENSKNNAHILSGLSAITLKINESDERGKYPIKLSKELLIDFLFWEQENYPHTLLSYISEIYLLIAGCIKETHHAHIEELLRIAIDNQQNSAFFELLYNQRMLVDEAKTVAFLAYYEHANENTSLFKEISDNINQHTKDKWTWLNAFISDHAELAYLGFSRTKGGLNDAEIHYLNNLIIDQKWDKYALFCCMLINNTDRWISERGTDYLIHAADAIEAAGYGFTDNGFWSYGGREVTANEYYGDFYRLRKVNKALCFKFACCLRSIIASINSGKDFIKKSCEDILDSLDKEISKDTEIAFMRRYNLTQAKDTIESDINRIEKIETNSQSDEISSKTPIQDCLFVNETNVATLHTEIREKQVGVLNFYKEALQLASAIWTGQPLTSMPLPDSNTPSYGTLKEKEFAYYLYWRTAVRNRTTTPVGACEAYINLYCTELLLGIGGLTQNETLDTFEWLHEQFKNIQRLALALSKFAIDYKTLHHLNNNSNTFEELAHDPLARINAVKSSVENGNNSVLYFVFHSNARYRAKDSTYLVKADYLDKYNSILNEIIVRVKNQLDAQNIDLLHYILGEKYGGYGQSDRYTQFWSNAVCPWNTIKKIVGYENLAPSFAYTKGKVTAVELVDEKGNFIRRTNMSVPCIDEDFCEYVVRYVENSLRKASGYMYITYPKKPSTDLTTPRHYAFPNGSSGYYYREDRDYSNLLLTVCPTVYSMFEKTADDYINKYFSEHPDELIHLRTAHAQQPIASKKTFIEKIADIVNEQPDCDRVITNVLESYKCATPTAKRTKANAVFSLLWNLWLLHATNNSPVQLHDILDAFADKENELQYKKAIVYRKFENALDSLKKKHNYSASVKDDEVSIINDCVIISLMALDKLLYTKYDLDIAELILGKFQTTDWDIGVSIDGIALKPTQCLKSIDGFEIYECHDTPQITTYQLSTANTAFVRYILKTIEQKYFDVKKKPKTIINKEDISSLFNSSIQNEVKAQIDKIIYYAVVCTTNRKSAKPLGASYDKITVRYDKFLYQHVHSTVNASVENLAKEAVITAFCGYYNATRAEVMIEETPCEGIRFDPQRSTYKDFFVEKYITNTPYTQEIPKMVLTRFYQLYDGYCDQLNEVFSCSVPYNPHFAIMTTKLMKNADGFVGKDLYLFAMIKEDGEDFLQWIEHIKHGELIYPYYQACVVFLYYYILNGKLFAERTDLGLAIMCKVWNHYFPMFSSQDANLILSWIKDYWMIHCSHISVQDFKRLFDRPIVFTNEYSISNIYQNGLLTYFNDICYYRVLNGKLVESGYKDIFEKTIKKVHIQIEALFRKHGVSLKNLMALAAGKNQYLYLRALVHPTLLKGYETSIGKIRLSENESYRLSYNNSTNRYQWTFSMNGYDIEFLRLFFEYVVKATEKELRKWLGVTIPKTFNVDITQVYNSKAIPNNLKLLLENDRNTGEINAIIKQCVATVCKESNIEQPQERISGISHERTGKYSTGYDYFADYGGIDMDGQVSAETLEEARRVLRGNQGKLVIEDEPTETKIEDAEPQHFNDVEIEVLRILLDGNDVLTLLEKLKERNIVSSVVITQINEKAVDLYGDILIDEDMVPPSIIDDNREMCIEVVNKNE